MMTIGKVATRSGLSASAIRFYERAGLLAAPFRESGRRIYDDGALHQLAIIRFAKDTGFTLPEIKLLLRGFPASVPASARWKKMASKKIEELEDTAQKIRVMKQLLRKVMCCECKTLADCTRYLGGNSRRTRGAD
jgi:MerR family redox-sensitive transcriptional activator SoxR